MHEQNGFVGANYQVKTGLHKTENVFIFMQLTWVWGTRCLAKTTLTKTTNLTWEEYLHYLFPPNLLTLTPFSLFHFFFYSSSLPFLPFFLIKKSLLSRKWKASMWANHAFPLSYHPFLFHPEGHKGMQKGKLTTILSNVNKWNINSFHVSCFRNITTLSIHSPNWLYRM